MELKKLVTEEYNQSENCTKYGNLLQTIPWGKVKSDNWKSDLIGIYEQSQLVGFFLSLSRKVGKKNLVYIARGPILFKSIDWSELTNLLKKFGKTNNAMVIKIDPLILREDNEDLVEKLIALGWDHKGYNKDFDTTTQPRFQAVVYKENLETIPKKLKQYVNLAKRRGVEIQHYSGKEALPYLDDFLRPIRATEKRQHISLRNREYYEKILTSFQNEVTLTIGYLDFAELLSNCSKKIAEVSQELSKDGLSKKRMHKLCETEVSLLKEKEVLEKNISTFGEKRVSVSSCLMINSNFTGELLYAGMDEEFKYFSPAYLTWYESICLSFESGTKAVNLGGVMGLEDDHLLSFKKNFNPTIEEYIGEFDLIINRPYNWFIKSAIQFVKKVRHFRK